MSPSLWWDDQFLVGLIEGNTGSKPDLRIYLDSGDAESGADLSATMRDIEVVAAVEGRSQRLEREAFQRNVMSNPTVREEIIKLALERLRAGRDTSSTHLI